MGGKRKRDKQLLGLWVSTENAKKLFREGKGKKKAASRNNNFTLFFPSSHEKKEEERGKGTLITKKWEKVPNRHLILPYRQSPRGKKKTVKEFRPRFIHLFLPSGENCLSNVQENKQVVTPLLRIPQARKRDGGKYLFALFSLVGKCQRPPRLKNPSRRLPSSPLS